jgi:hypothetical protein
MLSLLSLLHSRPTTPLVAPSLALFSSATAAAAAMAKQRNLGVQKVAAARGGAAPQPVTAAELLATISAAADVESHAERSWAYFRSLGSPKWHVAPMVDQVGAAKQQGRHRRPQLLPRRLGLGGVTAGVESLFAVGVCSACSISISIISITSKPAISRPHALTTSRLICPPPPPTQTTPPHPP